MLPTTDKRFFGSQTKQRHILKELRPYMSSSFANVKRRRNARETQERKESQRDGEKKRRRGRRERERNEEEKHMKREEKTRD